MKKGFLLILALASLFTAKAATVDPAGLTLHYRFDGNTNNAVAGIYGAATLVNNAVLTTGGGGFNGEALDLTATTGSGSDVSHTLLPENFTVGVTNFTLATWVKVTEDERSWSRILDFGNGTDNYMFITAYLDGHIRLVIKNQANGEQVIDGTRLPLNEWAHIAVTVASGSGSDGKDLGKLYVNGVCVGTKTDITNTLDGMGATTQNYIGRSQYGDAGYKGYVDDFRFYTRTLRPMEVKTLALHEGEALTEQYPFDGGNAETSLYTLPLKYRSDFKEVSLYGSSEGFVLSNETKDVTVTWVENPRNDIMIIGYYFDYSYTDGESAIQTGTHIYDEHNVAVFSNAPSGTYDLYTNGTQNDGDDDLSINEILAIDENATITITQIKLNDLWHGVKDYHMLSATVAGQAVQALSSYDIAGWAFVKPYSGEFTATEEGRQAFNINRFAIPEEFVGKYVRLDLSEATSDNWGFNLAFSKLNPDFNSGEPEGEGNWQYLGAGGWSDLNNPTVKIGNSYYYQITADAEFMNPQLWKNSADDTKTIKVAGFYLSDKIGDDIVFSGTGAWTDTERWSTGAVPVAADKVIVDGNATITADLEIAGITLTLGKSLTVNAGKQLTVTDVWANDGTLNLLSDGTDGNATILTPAEISGTGAANVQQYLSTADSRAWYYLASPVTGASSSLFGENDKVGNYTESTTSYSDPFTSETTLDAGRGYVAQLVGADNPTYTFSGALNNGTINIPVSRTGDTAPKRGFNLVGNPYPSYLNWDAVESENVQSTIWTRTFEAGQMVFKTYNADAGVGADDETTAHIAPLQAFWVKVPAEKADVSGLTLDFINAYRLHKGASDAGLRAAKAENRQLLRLAVSNGTNTDNAVILFDENAQDGFDNYDSEKMSNDNAAVPEIYTLAGSEKLVINSMSVVLQSSEEITLGFRTGATGSFTIQATAVKNMDSNLQIILKDKLLDTNFDLTEGNTYQFTSDVVNTENRFAIIFAPKTATEIKTAVNHNPFAVYSGAGRIRVKVSEPLQVSVYNTLGQCNFVSNQSVKNETTIAFPAGVYFVKVGNDVVKVLVK
jgi:hypothetical protein